MRQILAERSSFSLWSGKKIDFFIVGAQKSGTTSLYEYLKFLETKVDMPLVKEVMVFSNESLYRNAERNIRAFYKSNVFKKENNKKIGLADVKLLYFYENCANRIFEYNRNAKIIITLRNPIKRAYSSYLFSRRNQMEKSSSFEEAIQLERERINNLTNDNDHIALIYLDVSLYYKQVNYYINLFGKDNVMIIIFEEFIRDPYSNFLKILKFLDVDCDGIDFSFLGKKFNVGGGTRFKIISSLLFSNNIFRNLYARIFPLSFRMKIREILINKIIKLNSKEIKPQDINIGTFNNLKKYFENDIINLSQLLNKDLNQIWFNGK